MNFESYKIFFFLIHLINLLALVMHIGIKEDGFDVKSKRFSKNGKVATVLEGISMLAFLIFVYFYNDLCNLSSLYLGFSITIAIFSVPFLTTCHIKYSKSKVRLNFAGFVALLVGFSGFLTSFIWFFDSHTDGVVSTDMIDNYISILGQFIAGTSALIAFSGTTIESKDVKNDKGKPIPVTRLTDLGKVAITVIIIGFVVSIINFNLENAEKERVNIEVDQILEQAQLIAKNLDTANVFLTENLMPKTEHWLLEVNDKVENIKDLDKKLDAVQKRLKDMSTASEVLALGKQLTKYEATVSSLKWQLKLVAKETSVKELQTKLNQQQSRIATLQKRLDDTAKSHDIKELQKALKSSQAEINQLKQQLKKQAKASDIEALKKELRKLQQLVADTTR